MRNIATTFVLVSICALALTACSSSEGGSGARGVVSSSATIGATGGTVGTSSNAFIVVPAGALDQDTLISVASGSSIDLPAGVSVTGPAVQASPDGLTFNSSATVAIPVDSNMVPDGKTLGDLIVYRQESNGTITPLPVVGFDDNANLIFAATPGFSTFQTAVASGDFSIVPQTSLLKTEGVFFSEALTTTGGTTPVTFALVSTSKVDGIADDDAETAEGEIAPGVSFSSGGLISGTPTERGTWAFSVLATDSTAAGSQVSPISLTLTVKAQVNTTFASGTSQGLDFTYDDSGNLFALGNSDGLLTLFKIPADPLVASSSVVVGSGTSGTFTIAPDGSAIVVLFELIIGGDPFNQQIFAVEFDGDLNVVTAAFRVDADPVIDPDNPDETLTQEFRQALRPGAAFAIDRGVEPPDTPPATPDPLLYFVAYEQVRNLGSDEALRADVYGVWRAFGDAALTDEIRLDTTSLAGQTSGDPVKVVGNASGCLVLWTEQGGNNGDTSASAPLGTPGEIMALLMTPPTYVPASGTSPTTLPIEITPGTPASLNDETTTTGTHASATVSPDNQFFVVWTERDDTSPEVSLSSSSVAGRTSQASAILFRRPLTLRVAEATSGTASTSFLVDDIPVDGSALAGSVAVDSMGDIAVAWVKTFGDGVTPSVTLLRRFATGGTPLESSIEVGAGDPLKVAYDDEDALSVAPADGGSFIQTFTLDPDEVVTP